jgi:hypothetical protein
LASSELFQTLRKYVRGQADKYDIERADPMVYRVVEDPVKGLTKIQFDFQRDDDLLKRLGVSDNDIYFVNSIFSPHHNWGFLDESQAMNDFLEGYNIFYVLSDENLDTLRYILKVVDPAFNYEEIGSEESSNKRAAEIMMKVFPRETERIVDDYSSEIERAATEKATSVIDEELSEYLEKNEFKVVRRWDTISTTVGQLIMLYVKNGKVWLNFEDLFESIFDEEDNGWNWSEESYEWAYNADFDKDSFNRDASWQIDKMKDRVEEDENLVEFVEFYNRITKKFKPLVMYDLPKLKGVSFMIKDIDKDEMKVEVILRKDLKSISRKVSEENFYKLLYQPELFAGPFGNV